MSTRGSYPHPVLDASDDVATEFTVFNASIEVGVEHVTISFDVRCDDTDLADLISAQKAEISARWKCSATMRAGRLDLTRSHIATNVERFSAVLDHQELDGLVTVTVVAVAAERVASFRFANQHSHYGDALFDIERGDLLAHGGEFSFDAKKMYDPLSPPLESCFRFLQRSDSSKFIKVNTSGDDFVDVSFPPAVHQDFSNGFSPTIQMSTVVLPALMHAIEELKRDDGPPPTPDGWRTTLTKIITERRLEGRETIEIAQHILEDPIAHALKQLTSMGAIDD